jgi:hypothetical protein
MPGGGGEDSGIPERGGVGPPQPFSAGRLSYHFRTSRNSLGPLRSLRFRVARSSLVSASLPMRSICSPAAFSASALPACSAFGSVLGFAGAFASPSPTSRRMASGQEGVSGCSLIQSFRASICGSRRRTMMPLPRPVVLGRPRFFGICRLALFGLPPACPSCAQSRSVAAMLRRARGPGRRITQSRLARQAILDGRRAVPSKTVAVKARAWSERMVAARERHSGAQRWGRRQVWSCGQDVANCDFGAPSGLLNFA